MDFLLPTMSTHAGFEASGLIWILLVILLIVAIIYFVRRI